MHSTVLGDFQPINTWILDEQGESWELGENKPQTNVNGVLYDVLQNGDLVKASPTQKQPTKRTPKYLIDETTKKRYWNESESCVRTKCAALSLGTPLVHLIASVINVVYCALKLVSFYHFWEKKEGETGYSFKARLKSASQDVLRIVTAPFVLIALEFAALYGIFRPYDGRKLYATFERAQYGGFILAPCFQPNPQSHALGGDAQQRNAW